MTCSCCGYRAGEPIENVSTSDDKIALTMRCQNCGHEWLVQADQPAVFRPEGKFQMKFARYKG